ncbi:phage tail fiber protein [Pseudovibrio ascidiaceicola]|uniref:phage tail fiber domain-containing protein n=1 Tax=Pseudovibrio ascidiaceicola TaxID=285279 RepID=UPI003D36F13D
MASSKVEYPASGSTAIFNVPFGYLDKSHVHAYVDGVEVLFTWVGDASIRLKNIPQKDAVVLVQRSTPDKPVVDFTDGESLTERDLDAVNLQSLYLSQESADELTAVLQTDKDGKYNAKNRRIANTADPVNAQDVVTKKWAEQGMSSQLVQAEGHKETALTAASEAETSENRAAGHEAAAKSYRDQAKASEDKARSYKTSAEAAKQQTGTYASEAEATIATVRGLKDEATTQRNAARAHRDKAEEYSTKAVDQSSAAEGYKNSAKSYRDTANSHKASAESSKNTATNKAQEAATSASQAKTYRDQAAASVAEGVGQDTIDWGHLKPSLRDVLPDATQNAKFKKTLSVAGDFYLNNKAIISNDSEGEFADRVGSNIDHIWHDDSDDAWHFVSDAPYRSVGNTKLVATRLDLLNTDWSMTSSNRWLARYRCTSTNTENIPNNRYSDCLVVENKQHSPANATDESGKRFLKRGIISYSYIDGDSPGKTYEAYGALLSARQRGSSKVRSMGGLYAQCGTDNNSTGAIDYFYGARSYSFFNGSGRVGVCVGMHVGVNPNHANARAGDVRGIYTHMDYDAGTIENDPIALYQNYDGSWSGRKRVGIVQEGVQENRLTGKTLIDGDEVLHEGNAKAKLQSLGAGSRYENVQILTSSGNFTVPEGVHEIFVLLSGSGAGSRSNSADSTGARPGCVKMQVTPGEVIPYTIGGRRKGGDGYDSTFGANVRSKGGRSNNQHPAGNTGTDFDLPYANKLNETFTVESYKSIIYSYLTPAAIKSQSRLNPQGLMARYKSSSSKSTWSGTYPPGVNGSTASSYSEGGVAIVMY